MGDRMKSDDYVKYLTEQFIKYMSQPVNEKKTAKVQKKLESPPLSYRLFGLVPLTLSYYKRRVQRISKDIFKKDQE